MSSHTLVTISLNTTSLSVLCLYSAAAGVISHLAYFTRGEHHNQALLLFKLVFLVPAIFTITLCVFTDLGLQLSAIRSISCMATYLTALWTSMLLYRVFFHPLRHFPGPFPATLSKLWHVKNLVRDMRNYLFLHKLHGQYGDFVRTGPSELTVFVPAAVQIIHGPRTKCTKSPWYDRTLPMLALQSVRDKGIHDRRRRIWDHGFNANALRAYEDRIVGHSRTLLQQLHTHAGQAVSATTWFRLYGFDVMADLAFGRSFDMTKTGQVHYALDMLHTSMKGTMIISSAPWLLLIVKQLPGLSNKINKFIDWCSEQMMLRVKMNKQLESRDVVSWLVEAYEKSPPEKKEEELQWLRGDSRLIIVAGSDTTSATLTYAAYELASHPEHMQKLREELTGLAKNSDGTFNLQDLQNLDHLNGIINETLRLHPPVPSGLHRLTPPEGLIIGSTFIPGGTTVVVPTYTVGRSLRAYEKPNDFVPERWYARPDMIKDKSSYAPFSIGTYSCIGKQVALMELRTVLAMIAQDFDIEFLPGEDGSDFIKNSIDAFAMSVSHLQVVFRQRKE